MAPKPPLHAFGRPFYVKVAGASFLLGACIELFMIQTGFYYKVVVLEAEKRLDAQTGVAPEFGKRAPDPWAKQR